MRHEDSSNEALRQQLLATKEQLTRCESAGAAADTTPDEGQVTMETAFGKVLYNLAKSDAVELVLETGTWKGGGSSLCIAKVIHPWLCALPMWEKGIRCAVGFKGKQWISHHNRGDASVLASSAEDALRLSREVSLRLYGCG